MFISTKQYESFIKIGYHCSGGMFFDFLSFDLKNHFGEIWWQFPNIKGLNSAK